MSVTMTKELYAAYLESPRWKLLREIVLDLHEHRCVMCGRPATTVHHNNYERIGHERLHDLTVTCTGCHKRFHRIREARGCFQVRSGDKTWNP